MTAWQSGVVESDDVRLHYTRTGGDKPPIVLAHGVTDSGLCWTPVAEALEAEYDLILVDARGHGQSSAPQDGYGPDDQADDLHALINALGLQRPTVLGHSMGAGTALVLAGTYPNAVGAILLEDPPAWWIAPRETSPMSAERTEQMRAWALGVKQKSREELITEQHLAAPAWSDGELGPWADSKLQFSPNVLNVFSSRNVLGVDWPTTLQRIACPALLITADPALGAIITTESAASLGELVPQLHVAHLPGAGHNIRREQFAAYMDAVRAFLAEHVQNG